MRSMILNTSESKESVIVENGMFVADILMSGIKLFIPDGLWINGDTGIVEICDVNSKSVMYHLPVVSPAIPIGLGLFIDGGGLTLTFPIVGGKNGQVLMADDVDLYSILSLQEAAELWELDDSTLRKAIASGKFIKNEYRKTGRNYIIKKSAMERIYGEPKTVYKKDTQ